MIPTILLQLQCKPVGYLTRGELVCFHVLSSAISYVPCNDKDTVHSFSVNFDMIYLHFSFSDLLNDVQKK